MAVASEPEAPGSRPEDLRDLPVAAEEVTSSTPRGDFGVGDSTEGADDDVVLRAADDIVEGIRVDAPAFRPADE